MPSTKNNGQTVINMDNLEWTKWEVTAKEESSRWQARWKRMIGIFNLVLRTLALIITLIVAIAMRTTNVTIPFFTQFLQFEAGFDDLPTFGFFVVAMAILTSYLILSMPFSIVVIIHPHIVAIKLLLFMLDTVMMVLTTAAGAATAAIVHLARNENSNTDWSDVCQQSDDFCKNVSGVVAATFMVAIIFISLLVLSAMTLRTY